MTKTIPLAEAKKSMSEEREAIGLAKKQVRSGETVSLKDIKRKYGLG